MKNAISLIFILLISSCAGFFYDGLSRDGSQKVQTLALADGSGYISTDNYNEITPYLYRDTNSGRAWLFFASDRDGNYDIYCAEMFPDGKFAKPVKMDAQINTTDGEYSPIVFEANYDVYTGLFITFIRDTLEESYITTYRLDQDFHYVASMGGDIPDLYVTRISLVQGDVPYLVVVSNEPGWVAHDWDSFYGYWSFSGWQNTISIIDRNVDSMNGFRQHVGVEQDIDWYVFDAIRNGKHQIYGGAISYNGGQNFYPMPLYVSSYNDRDPFVDPNDFRVYFSSDRYGKGNYDLYRYNLARYDFSAPLPLEKPQITLESWYPEYPVRVSWQAIAGASHYHVFRSPDNEFYEIIADTVSTYFEDMNVTNGFWYYYRIQAVNYAGVSDRSDMVGGFYDTGPV